MYHKDGGQGAEILGTRVQGAAWPSASRDGKYLYFMERTPGEVVNWAARTDDNPDADDDLVADLFQGAYQLRRLELRNGSITPVTSGLASRQYRLSNGGAIAGEVSPDGRWLASGDAFRWHDQLQGPRVRSRSALWLRDLETGKGREILMDPIEQDMSRHEYRGSPRLSWMPDGKSSSLRLAEKLGASMWRRNVSRSRSRRVVARCQSKRGHASASRTIRSTSHSQVATASRRQPAGFEAIGRIG